MCEISQSRYFFLTQMTQQLSNARAGLFTKVTQKMRTRRYALFLAIHFGVLGGFEDARASLRVRPYAHSLARMAFIEIFKVRLH